MCTHEMVVQLVFSLCSVLDAKHSSISGGVSLQGGVAEAGRAAQPGNFKNHHLENKHAGHIMVLIDTIHNNSTCTVISITYCCNMMKLKVQQCSILQIK